MSLAEIKHAVRDWPLNDLQAFKHAVRYWPLNDLQAFQQWLQELIQSAEKQRKKLAEDAGREAGKNFLMKKSECDDDDNDDEDDDDDDEVHDIRCEDGGDFEQASCTGGEKRSLFIDAPQIPEKRLKIEESKRLETRATTKGVGACIRMHSNKEELQV
eukprot:7191001-Karenia_brevis.AAC.1